MSTNTDKDNNKDNTGNSRVILAKTAGFCFGVQRAVDMVYEQIKDQKNQNIYTFGPIIHNEEVVNDLRSKGVHPVEKIDDIKTSGEKKTGEEAKSVLIIRSHGVGREIYESAEQNHISVVDATCPFVKKIHNIVARDSAEGRYIIVIGDSKHAEVQGITGWIKGPFAVIQDEKEAEDFFCEQEKGITVVSQTTFNHNKFNNLVEIIGKKGYDIKVTNTICNATMERQKEAASLARQVDLMLVVGDRHSSNTRKLYEICRMFCADTYYIQTVEDLDEQNLQSGISVGITAGASTPNYIIQEVFLRCQKKKVSIK